MSGVDADGLVAYGEGCGPAGQKQEYPALMHGQPFQPSEKVGSDEQDPLDNGVLWRKYGNQFCLGHFLEGFKSFLNNILSFVKEIFGFANIMLMRRLENKFGRNIHIISH